MTINLNLIYFRNIILLLGKLLYPGYGPFSKGFIRISRSSGTHHGKTGGELILCIQVKEGRDEFSSSQISGCTEDDHDLRINWFHVCWYYLLRPGETSPASTPKGIGENLSPILLNLNFIFNLDLLGLKRKMFRPYNQSSALVTAWPPN